jgi:nitrite reductase (NADH) small subunit
MADILVCKDGDIKEGGARVVRAGDVEIGVIHHGGKYYAYRNLCPHQGGPACEGLRMPQVIDVIGPDGSHLGQKFDEKDIHIVCPWHGYEYHLVDGVNVCNSRIRLQKFNVTQRNGEIYVAV